MWRFYSPSHFQLPRWVQFVEAKDRQSRFHLHAVLKTRLLYFVLGVIELTLSQNERLKSVHYIYYNNVL